MGPLRGSPRPSLAPLSPSPFVAAFTTLCVGEGTGNDGGVRVSLSYVAANGDGVQRRRSTSSRGCPKFAAEKRWSFPSQQASSPALLLFFLPPLSSPPPLPIPCSVFSPLASPIVRAPAASPPWRMHPPLPSPLLQPPPRVEAAKSMTRLRCLPLLVRGRSMMAAAERCRPAPDHRLLAVTAPCRPLLPLLLLAPPPLSRRRCVASSPA